MARLGQLLWDENRLSIEHRYPDTAGDKFEATWGDCEYGEHAPSVHTTINPAQVVQSCRCFEYQACEHPGWESSEACAFVRALERSAVSAMLSDDLDWGAPKGWQDKSNVVALSTLFSK